MKRLALGPRGPTGSQSLRPWESRRPLGSRPWPGRLEVKADSLPRMEAPWPAGWARPVCALVHAGWSARRQSPMCRPALRATPPARRQSRSSAGYARYLRALHALSPDHHSPSLPQAAYRARRLTRCAPVRRATPATVRRRTAVPEPFEGSPVFGSPFGTVGAAPSTPPSGVGTAVGATVGTAVGEAAAT